jgi:EAL domain-containing protein (putative c-di-GMP-specific phosphodiesterase class I)
MTTPAPELLGLDPEPDLEAPAPAGRNSNSAQLGQRLLRLLAPLQVQRLTLHGGAGELLWMNRGRWGASDQRWLRNAEQGFALKDSEPYLERELEDGRRALYFCARTPSGERTSLAFAVIEAPDGALDAAPIRARVLAAMHRYGLSMTARIKVDATAPATPAPEAGADPAGAHAPLKPLRLRRYSRLRSAGATRRYEIAAEPTSMSADLDGARRLMHWLQRRGTRASRTPATFTLPLSTESVLSPDFMMQLAPIIQAAALAQGVLGLRIASPLAAQDGLATERFIAACAAQGCFVALDDFNLTGAAFALLRSSAVRCLKLDPALTADVLSDKFSRASVVAIVKAARVLGLYCVAKDLKSAASARWLGSAGVDYAFG